MEKKNVKLCGWGASRKGGAPRHTAAGTVSSPRLWHRAQPVHTHNRLHKLTSHVIAATGLHVESKLIMMIISLKMAAGIICVNLLKSQVCKMARRETGFMHFKPSGRLFDHKRKFDICFVKWWNAWLFFPLSPHVRRSSCAVSYLLVYRIRWLVETCEIEKDLCVRALNIHARYTSFLSGNHYLLLGHAGLKKHQLSYWLSAGFGCVYFLKFKHSKWKYTHCLCGVISIQLFLLQPACHFSLRSSGAPLT